MLSCRSGYMPSVYKWCLLRPSACSLLYSPILRAPVAMPTTRRSTHGVISAFLIGAHHWVTWYCVLNVDCLFVPLMCFLIFNVADFVGQIVPQWIIWVCMCVYVYVGVCRYVCVYLCVVLYMCMCVCVYVCVCTYVLCVCACACVHVYLCIHT